MNQPETALSTYINQQKKLIAKVTKSCVLVPLAREVSKNGDWIECTDDQFSGGYWEDTYLYLEYKYVFGMNSNVPFICEIYVE